MFEKDISPESRSLFRSKDEPLLRYRELFKELMFDLLQMQRRIFNLQKAFYLDTKFDLSTFKPKEFAKLIESSKVIEHEKEYSFFNVFDIPTKSKNNDDIDLIAMTDDDDDIHE